MPAAAGRDPFLRKDWRRLRKARKNHRRTLEAVLRELKRKELQVRVTDRWESGRRFDAVISVGGDGTFLEAAQGVRSEPVLGVNSDPVHSVGSFCAAERRNFARLLDRMRRGRARSMRLHRLNLKLDGRLLPVEVLNDLLITHRRPAAMSRYWLRIGRQTEEQHSSGLWIATAAGSTGAIRSAGGRRMPVRSRARVYRPRELYRGRGFRYRLTGGPIPAGKKIEIGSLMQEGLICVDGEHRTIPFRYGQKLEIVPSKHPLKLVIG